MSQTIDDLFIACVFFTEPLGERPFAQPQRLRHSLPVGFAMWQQLLHFVLDQGPKRPTRRVALLRRLLANGLDAPAGPWRPNSRPVGLATAGMDFGIDKARTNCVDPDPFGAQLFWRDPRSACRSRPLMRRSRYKDWAIPNGLPPTRSAQSSGAAGGFRQPPRGLACGEKCAQHIDLEDVAHALGAHIDELGRWRDYSGVGDDRGQGPERLCRCVEHVDRVGFDRHVAFERDGAAAAFGDRLDDGVGGFCVLAIIDADGPAVLGGEQRAGVGRCRAKRRLQGELWRTC